MNERVAQLLAMEIGTARLQNIQLVAELEHLRTQLQSAQASANQSTANSASSAPPASEH